MEERKVQSYTRPGVCACNCINMKCLGNIAVRLYVRVYGHYRGPILCRIFFIKRWSNFLRIFLDGLCSLCVQSNNNKTELPWRSGILWDTVDGAGVNTLGGAGMLPYPHSNLGLSHHCSLSCSTLKAIYDASNMPRAWYSWLGQAHPFSLAQPGAPMETFNVQRWHKLRRFQPA